MAWTTTANVLARTGATVTDTELAQAVAVIELESGITEDNATELSESNTRMLARATEYQAAWMAAQVDVTSRMDATRIEQDGVQIEVASTDALIIAPLARRCLNRLSWTGRRSFHLTTEGPRFGTVESWQAAFLSDQTADTWRSIA